MFLLLAVTALEGLVACDTIIRSASEFVEFSNNVNSGKSKYAGETVILDSDIDFAGEGLYELAPIGNSQTKHFRGTFDGRGHVISNYVLNSSVLDSIGLFGYSRKMAIKNLVFDSSCSVTSSYNDTNVAYVGSIIGRFYGADGSCEIGNVVSLASLSFSGNTTSSISLGGIVGGLYQGNTVSDSRLRNCVNYGTITAPGKTGESFIGGVIGSTSVGSGGSPRYIYIQNCLSSGSIICGSSLNTQKVGGIVGDAKFVKIGNCVSAGTIVAGKSYGYVGTLVGDSYSTVITHSMWTSDVGYSRSYGSGNPSIRNGTSQTSLNSSVLVELNDFSAGNGWNRWLLNPDNASVSFTIDYGKGFTVESQIVLFPTPDNSSAFVFNGWYSDESLTDPFLLDEVAADTTLYGSICESNLTVTFDVNGGSELSVEEISIGCNGTYEILPNPTKTEATFDGWFTKRDGGRKVNLGDRVVIPRDHILYAQWTPNKYTVAFILGNGSDPEMRTFDFNETVEYPKNVTRVGYMFNGWDKDIEFMPANNLTITAQWTLAYYMVSLNPNGGNELPVKEIQVTFNGTYGSLPVPNRTGYTFLYWATEKDESVTSETVVSVPENHTLWAQWSKIGSGKIEVPINNVEIVFGTKDLTKEELEDIVGQYTNAEYKILSFESDGTSETRVILKFTDFKEAKSFVESVKASSGSLVDLVKFIDLNSGAIISFSLISYPMVLLSIIAF